MTTTERVVASAGISGAGNEIIMVALSGISSRADVQRYQCVGVQVGMCAHVNPFEPFGIIFLSFYIRSAQILFINSFSFIVVHTSFSVTDLEPISLTFDFTLTHSGGVSW
jgi:hypothetical protein